jgi:hypothetical protein
VKIMGHRPTRRRTSLGKNLKVTSQQKRDI